MNVKRYALSLAAVFIAVFVLDFIIHGILLKESYAATAHLWRPQEEYKMPFMMLAQLLFAAIFTYIFTLNYEGKGIGEGVRYGLYIGLLLAAINLGSFAYMPISLSLALSWVGADIAKGIIAGIALSLTYGE